MTDEVLNDAVRRRDEWVAARLREVAPVLADVPERRARLLQSVQCMLVASNGHEASRYAREVAREAKAVAILNVEYNRTVARLMERAPLELRLPVNL